MKVAFYIANRTFDSAVDLTKLHLGNPGIGGTEYVMLLVSQYLSYTENMSVYLYVDQKGNFATNLNIFVIPDIEKAAMDAAEKGCTRFIFDCKWIDWSKEHFLSIPCSLKLIAWNHNIINAKMLRNICRNKRIVKIVNVGREQRDLFRDDWTFKYADYIYNCVPLQDGIRDEVEKYPFEKRKHIVTYIGSLTSRKSFHVLAQIWPDVIKQVPDAELYVIGSAGLYDNIEKLGPYNMAEESYEATFMPYLTKDGKILSSVHFLGALGIGKNEVLLKSKVGVPNPTGKTETFCLSAVEMQLAGCVTTAIQAPGYFDTMYNGVLVHDKKQLTSTIVKLLLSDRPIKQYNETFNFIEKNFGIQKVANQWLKLLMSDMTTPISPVSPLVNSRYRHKWLKEILRQIKHLVPVLYKFPYTLEDFMHKYEKIFKEWEYRLY